MLGCCSLCKSCKSPVLKTTVLEGLWYVGSDGSAFKSLQNSGVSERINKPQIQVIKGCRERGKLGVGRKDAPCLCGA